MRKPHYYWDACIFIAWLKNETRPPGEMEGVEAVARQVEDREAVLVTSVTTLTEVLRSTLSHEAQRAFEDVFKQPNIVSISVDMRIARLAEEIRDYYQQRKLQDGLPTIETPDATHLATAIHYKVDEFHTFDENDKPRKKRALIPLSGNVAGYNLKICKPQTKQLRFQGEGF